MPDETNPVIETAPQSEKPAVDNNASEPAKVVDSAAEPAKASGILESDSTKDKAVQPNFPENWREIYSKGDEKKLGVLKRYASVEAALDAKFEADKKISSYKPQVELPENPTEADISKYRKAYGIPEKPEGYDTKLDKGIIIGEHDKFLVEKFLERAHARNAKPSEVKAALQDHFENMQLENERINTKISEQREKASDELHKEWGSSFRTNINVIENFLENQFGSEEALALRGAVLADGTVLKDNPKILRKFLAMANDIDPIATIGGNSSGGAQGIAQELAKIDHLIATDPDKYWNDQSMVTRRAELKATLEKVKSRS